MKLLCTGALAAAALGWFGLAADDAPSSPCPIAGECEATVECLPDGTCRIECEGPDGATCWILLGCDGGSCEVLDSGGDDCAPQSCEQSEG